MKKYDPGKMIIGLHIPKCAGNSLKEILRQWFGFRLRSHHINEQLNLLPPHQCQSWRWKLLSRCRLAPCIYGHFNAQRGVGVFDYYPRAGQFFTIVRDPLAMALSRYFYGKQQGSNRMRNGKPALMANRYTCVDDFLADQLNESYFKPYLPGNITLDNYMEIFESHFVYIGVAEDLQNSVNGLARRLGFNGIQVPHMNTSHYDELVAGHWHEDFMAAHPFDYAVYRFALDHYRL